MGLEADEQLMCYQKWQESTKPNQPVWDISQALIQNEKATAIQNTQHQFFSRDFRISNARAAHVC